MGHVTVKVIHKGQRQIYCRLVFQELCSSSYFEGGEEYKIFAHNFEGLEREEYGLVENLVRLSLVHDGPGLCILNPSLAKLM
ncbi:hypothetical protein DPMN_027888 [Dreissena polymorpha]|uniref:Uncharacterized protein n=1 Tax=Dreissena polymorpha TaxID=45954 RepID=A0A9D4RFL9_DREPO|nr:hypothetical protein DPMN_027888 [Dreissena polymorpha]